MLPGSAPIAPLLAIFWGHNLASPSHARQQVHDQCDPDAKGAARSQEHSGSGAILDDLNLPMILRLHVIGEMLECRIEQLGRQDCRATQRDGRPPDRLGPKESQHENRPGQGDELITETVLRAHGDAESCECASQPQSERLILRSPHCRRILRQCGPVRRAPSLAH